MIENILFKIAETESEFSQAKELFIQYAHSLDIDLAFQGFDNELENIQQQYGKPKGALILAYAGSVPAGCVGIRAITDDTCELKRMFVIKEYRGLRMGENLLDNAITSSRQMNYNKMRLDTLSTMTAAIQLYRSKGFYEIEAYRFNPFDGAVYMEKLLNA
jgi:putative acetyltransferase